MPRKKPSNQHNNRHENGIVAPGKRITKQKSNGHLNGSAVGSLPSSASIHPTASDGRLAALQNAKQSDKQNDNIAVTYAQVKEHDAHATSETRMPPAEFNYVNGALHDTLKRPVRSAPKSHEKRKDGSVSLPLTIIRSCPLADTLTILIILLSIPSTMLTLINTLFAMLTFMPPASSIFSIPNTINDIFQGSGGSPTLATIMITDLLGLLIWLVAWSPVQALAIEYAQAVVAATLGGSNTNKKTGYDSTFLCMAIVSARHIFDRGWIPQRLVVFDWRAILSRIPYAYEKRHSFLDFSNYDGFTTESRGGWWWLRVLIALHILIQGLVHVARRWYQRREYFHSPPTLKKHDPEAGANNPARPGPNPLGDAALSSNNTPSPSATPKSSLPILKDSREKASSGKRRRKQAALVRSQQPLWAAFAATKVTIMREYESSHSAADSAEAKSRDTYDLGDASFVEREYQTWITGVYPDHFILHATLPSDFDPDDGEPSSEDSSSTELGQPFHVRVNDAEWTSTTISKVYGRGKHHDEWIVKVFGLAPSSSYRCSLMSTEGDEALDTLVVTTSPLVLEESEPNARSVETAQSNQPPCSPTSPSTTLRKSIAGYETSYSEALARQRRSKKDNKNAANNIRKEIEGLNAKISKIASEDRAHTNRHLQWNQNIKQADEAVIAISQELESLEAIPEDEVLAHKEKQQYWEEARRRQQSLRDQLHEATEAAQSRKTAVMNEFNAARQKKERLQGRKAKLNDLLEKLESSTPPSLRNEDDKRAQPTAKEMQHAQQEQELQRQMVGMQQAWQESRSSTAQYLAQVQQLESEFQAHMMSITPERPLTPEGDLPGENPQNAASIAPRVPAFGTPESNGLRSHSGSLRLVEHRLRSSSLQSNGSKSIELDVKDSAPPLPFKATEAIRDARKRSGGSAEGSSGSSSQRDPASPIGGHRSQDSPLGKKNPIWNS